MYEYERVKWNDFRHSRPVIITKGWGPAVVGEPDPVIILPVLGDRPFSIGSIDCLPFIV